MGPVLAAIPYTTFPTIDLGPLNLRTFGLMVALGVLLGAWIAASYAERFGVSRDETYRVATWMVLAGIVGSRLTWAATHTDQIDSPIDIIAIWEGGIQFSGGFVCALIVGLPFFRRWTKLQRWHVLDGYALGLTLGLALGRVGCYSVGEHFGRVSGFFLATRYDGGEVREPTLGDTPLVPGTTFHNTALYEFLYLMVLFAVLGAAVLATRRRGREVPPGTIVGVFVLYYGITRWLSARGRRGRRRRDLSGRRRGRRRRGGSGRGRRPGRRRDRRRRERHPCRCGRRRGRGFERRG